MQNRGFPGLGKTGGRTECKTQNAECRIRDSLGLGKGMQNQGFPEGGERNKSKPPVELVVCTDPKRVNYQPTR